MNVPVDRDVHLTSPFPNGFPPALTSGTNTTGGVHHDDISYQKYKNRCESKGCKRLMK